MKWSSISSLSLALLLMSAPALAAGNLEVSVEDDGVTVRAVIDLDAAPAQVMLILGDPLRAAQLSEDIHSIEVQPVDGGCFAVEVTTTGIRAPFRYKARRCVGARGSEERLSSSADYEALWSSWEVRPRGTGSRVVLRNHTVLVAAVPRFLVRRGVKRALPKMLGALAKALGEDP